MTTTHKHWNPGTLMAQAYRDIANEHNATVDALEAALAPIRVPFSDEVIEKMARAACDAGDCSWPTAIRAALAAGGLEPCAVPEYAPEDVAFGSERASDDELARIGYEASPSMSVADTPITWTGGLFDSHRKQHVARAAAVRARVEAPLLAEIRHLRGKLASAHQKTERQAADLTKLYHLRQGDAGERRGLESEIARLQNQWNMAARAESDRTAERNTLRAQLEAVTAERDEMCHQQTKRCMSWRRCFNLAFRLKNKYRAELAALRQPMDAPSVEQCSKIAQASLRDAQLGGLGNGEQIYVVARDVRDAVLAGLTAPTATPTDAQVEALARAIYRGAGGCQVNWAYEGIKKLHMDAARAAYAHIGRVPVGWELDVTADEALRVYSNGGKSIGGMHNTLDLCRSRIKPAYECKECAKRKTEMKARLDNLAAATYAIRAALEGE